MMFWLIIWSEITALDAIDTAPIDDGHEPLLRTEMPNEKTSEDHHSAREEKDEKGIFHSECFDKVSSPIILFFIMWEFHFS